MKNLKYITITILTLISLTPTIAHAQTSTPLGEVSGFGQLISVIWAYGSNVIIALAVFFIVLGAFFYVASGGKEERISQGKEMIFGSLVAIVIVILSGVLMRTLHKPAEGSAGNLGEVPEVIGNATNILTGLIGGFTVVMLLYAAILYISGKGDPVKIEKAHNAFYYAIYGLVIGVLAYAIANAVIRFLI